MKLSNKALWSIIGGLLFTLYWRAGIDGLGAGVCVILAGVTFFSLVFGGTPDE